jgi:hypothetical protein
MTREYLKPLLAFVIGGITGILCLIYSQKTTPTKKYPITVQCYWQTNGYSSYPKFECDSIKGDTCYKDGNIIVTKNIINISFN